MTRSALLVGALLVIATLSTSSTGQTNLIDFKRASADEVKSNTVLPSIAGIALRTHRTPSEVSFEHLESGSVPFDRPPRPRVLSPRPPALTPRSCKSTWNEIANTPGISQMDKIQLGLENMDRFISLISDSLLDMEEESSVAELDFLNRHVSRDYVLPENPSPEELFYAKAMHSLEYMIPMATTLTCQYNILSSSRIPSTDTMRRLNECVLNEAQAKHVRLFHSLHELVTCSVNEHPLTDSDVIEGIYCQLQEMICVLHQLVDDLESLKMN